MHAKQVGNGPIASSSSRTAKREFVTRFASARRYGSRAVHISSVMFSSVLAAYAPFVCCALVQNYFFARGKIVDNI
jgi:hypothetical protein